MTTSTTEKPATARAEPPAAAGPRRRPRREPLLLTVAGLALLPAFFELAPRVGLVPSHSFPPTSTVVAELGRLMLTVEYWRALGETVTGWLAAAALAFVIGVPLGLAIGASRPGQLLSRVTIDFLRPIPSVALIPLLVLIFGTNQSLKIALGTFGGVFPLLFGAMYGVGDIDPVARDSARSCGLGRAAVIRRMVLPTATPFVVTGARLAFSVVLLLVVTGEYIIGVAGLGRSVLDAQNSGAYAAMYAYVITAGLIGLALNGALAGLERVLLFWHPSQRERAT